MLNVPSLYVRIARASDSCLYAQPLCVLEIFVLVLYVTPFMYIKSHHHHHHKHFLKWPKQQMPPQGPLHVKVKL